MTAIREVCKAANCQIKDPITVSYFFFAQTFARQPSFFTASPLAPHVCSQFTVIKKKIRDCSQSNVSHSAVNKSKNHRKWKLIL